MTKGTESYVKLFRKIVEWEWFKDSELVHLFLYLIVRANYTDGKWRGITIKRGQHVTTLETISEKTGISVQRVRTIIKKLKSTNELTCESTNRFSLITIVQYDLYQSNEEKLTSASTDTPTNEQQTINKQSTNNQHVLKKEEEIKEGKEVNNTLSTHEENFDLETQKKEDTPLPPSRFKAFDEPQVLADEWERYQRHRILKGNPLYANSPNEEEILMKLYQFVPKNEDYLGSTEAAVEVIKFTITKNAIHLIMENREAPRVADATKKGNDINSKKDNLKAWIARYTNKAA